MRTLLAALACVAVAGSAVALGDGAARANTVASGPRQPPTAGDFSIRYGCSDIGVGGFLVGNDPVHDARYRVDVGKHPELTRQGPLLALSHPSVPDRAPIPSRARLTV